MSRSNEYIVSRATVVLRIKRLRGESTVCPDNYLVHPFPRCFNVSHIPSKMSNLNHLVDQLVFFTQNNGLPSLETCTNVLGRLSTQEQHSIKRLAIVLQSGCQGLTEDYQKTLLDWKADIKSFFATGRDITTFFWLRDDDRESITFCRLVHQRLCLCSLFRVLKDKRFHTGKQWRQYALETLSQRVKTYISREEGVYVSQKDIEWVLQNNVYFGKYYHECAEEHGGDAYLFVMAGDSEKE